MARINFHEQFYARLHNCGEELVKRHHYGDDLVQRMNKGN